MSITTTNAHEWQRLAWQMGADDLGADLDADDLDFLDWAERMHGQAARVFIATSDALMTIRFGPETSPATAAQPDPVRDALGQAHRAGLLVHYLTRQHFEDVAGGPISDEVWADILVGDAYDEYCDNVPDLAAGYVTSVLAEQDIRPGDFAPAPVPTYPTNSEGVPYLFHCQQCDVYLTAAENEGHADLTEHRVDDVEPS